MQCVLDARDLGVAGTGKTSVVWKPLVWQELGLSHALRGPSSCASLSVRGGVIFVEKGLVALFHPPQGPVEPWLCAKGVCETIVRKN